MHVMSSSVLEQPTTKAKLNGKKGTKNNKEPSDKPRRPLSAYNLFFQHERAQILQATPSKYDDTKPRRSHGKIGFGALARNVAAKWNSIDPDTRKHFDDLAAADKHRYKREMETWKASLTVTKTNPVTLAMANEESLMSMNAPSIVRCNLIASQNSGCNVIPNSSAIAFNNSQQQGARFLFQNFGHPCMSLDMRSNKASTVVGHALALLEDDSGSPIVHSMGEYTLHRVESEEASLESSSICSSGRRESVPHISELAAKLDDDCLGFMSGLLY